MNHVGRVLDTSDSRVVAQSRNGWNNIQAARAAANARATKAAGPYDPMAATERQLDFLAKLRAERVVSEKLELAINVELEQPAGPGKKEVSKLIDELVNLPKKEAAVKFAQDRQGALPEVPAGRYAVPGADGKLRFVKVDRPADGPWAGRTFVQVQASDDFFRLRGDQPRKALEAIIAAGPREAAIRYGHEIGRCAICGRTLTDEDSRAAGIGPVCAQKVGW